MNIRGLFLVALCLAASATQAREPIEEAFDRDVLVVAARSACFRFDIYLALTREQQRRGLMWVRELPATTGMLFVYPADRYLSIWMKNTFISLDVLFVKQDGLVSSIFRDATPQSEKSMTASEPVRYVLELNAGVSESLGIEPGSTLIWEPALMAGPGD